MTRVRRTAMCFANIAVVFILACSASAGKAAFIGTWQKVNGSGVMTITDNENSLMIRDDHGQTFTGTINRTGELQTSIMVTMSIDKTTGHLVWINGEYALVKATPLGVAAAAEAKVRDARERTWLDQSGLTWTTKDNGHGKVDWNDATAYCAALRVGGFADWRLPSIDELERVSDQSLPGKVKIQSPLTLTGHEPQWVWSSTKRDTSTAWTFHFVYGVRNPVALDDSRFDDARILCVRRAGGR